MAGADHVVAGDDHSLVVVWGEAGAAVTADLSLWLAGDVTEAVVLALLIECADHKPRL